MIIYNYDPITGEYLSSSQAVIDPLESRLTGITKFLIPANATQIIPGNSKNGYVQCFDVTKNAWVSKEDHRGKTVWKKDTLEEVTISDIGEIPTNYLTEYPKPLNEYQIWENGQYIYPDMVTVKTQLKSQLDRKYSEKLATIHKVKGFYVKPEWATTYTNTLVAMQQDIDADGNLDETYKILLITNPTGTLQHVTVKNIDEFMPYYNKVKQVYKKLTEEYHRITATIVNSKDLDTMIAAVDNY